MRIIDILWWALGFQRPAPAPAPTPPPAGNAILAEINRQRVGRGYAPLTEDSRLTADATAHSRWMAATGNLTHTGADGTPPERLAAVGYGWSDYGENVAAGQTTAAECVGDWMQSTGHRANVLGPFTEGGAAVAVAADGQAYWTFVGATPVSA